MRYPPATARSSARAWGGGLVWGAGEVAVVGHTVAMSPEWPVAAMMSTAAIAMTLPAISV